MKTSFRTAIRLAIEKCGFRIFPKNGFYHNFVPYSRFGFDPIHYLRHFIDVGEIKTCVDVGANKGQTAAYFSDVFPSATIYSFEPVRDTFSQLVANTSHLPRVKAFNFALGRTAGSVKIALADDNQTNTLVANPRDGHPVGRSIESIEVRTLDAFMDEHGLEKINLLKTDTEGFDLEVLNGASAAFAQKRVDLVYSEVGFQPGDLLHTYFDNVLRFLAGHDFAFLGLYETVFCDNPTQLFHANALFGRKESVLLKPWVD